MKTKLLIVEDDPHIVLGLEEVLKGEGFDVAMCNRGDTALDAVGRHRPSLILLDVMLPGLSGYDICRQLRTRKVATPILMLTAKGQEIDKVVGLDLGADDYITKPLACANCWRASMRFCGEANLRPRRAAAIQRRPSRLERRRLTRKHFRSNAAR